ncbi:hypothetical protein N7467_006552 [Penicillium canescens]|nr:hypothetical protein N7467_006552 [Penicillium canescens]
MALFSRLAGYYTGHVTKLDGPYSFSVPVSIALNIIGLLFLLFAAITFNAAIGVVALISGMTWITTGRKQFSGPGAVSLLRGENTATQNVAGADAQRVDEKKT